MAAHSSILTRTTLWTEETDRLWSTELRRVGHDLMTEHVCAFRGIQLDTFATRNGIYFLIYFHKLRSAFQN